MPKKAGSQVPSVGRGSRKTASVLSVGRGSRKNTSVLSVGRGSRKTASVPSVGRGSRKTPRVPTPLSSVGLRSRKTATATTQATSNCYWPSTLFGSQSQIQKKAISIQSPKTTKDTDTMSTGKNQRKGGVRRGGSDKAMREMRPSGSV